MQRCYSFGEDYLSNYPPNLVFQYPKVVPVHAANIKQEMGDVVFFWKKPFHFEVLLIKRNSDSESNVSQGYHKVIPIHLSSYFWMKRSEVLLGAGLNYFWCIQSLYVCSVFIINSLTFSYGGSFEAQEYSGDDFHHRVYGLRKQQFCRSHFALYDIGNGVNSIPGRFGV